VGGLKTPKMRYRGMSGCKLRPKETTQVYTIYTLRKGRLKEVKPALFFRRRMAGRMWMMGSGQI